MEKTQSFVVDYSVKTCLTFLVDVVVVAIPGDG